MKKVIILISFIQGASVEATFASLKPAQYSAASSRRLYTPTQEHLKGEGQVPHNALSDDQFVQEVTDAMDVNDRYRAWQIQRKTNRTYGARQKGSAAEPPIGNTYDTMPVK